MTALDPGTVRRLRGALSLLSSPSQGERLAAVDAVERLLDKAGLDFTDLAPANVTAGGHLRQRTPPADYTPGLYRLHQVTAHQLLRCGHGWSEWEADFLQDMAWQARPLSPPQWEKLHELEAVEERRAA